MIEKEILIENINIMHKNMNNICGMLDVFLKNTENIDDEYLKNQFKTTMTKISIPAVAAENAFSIAVECLGEDNNKYAGITDIEADFGTALYIDQDCICLKLPRAHSKFSKMNIYSRLNTDFVKSLVSRNKGSIPYFTQKMIVVVNVYTTDKHWVDPDNVDIKSVIDSLVSEAELGGDSGRNTVYMSMCVKLDEIEAATYLLVVPEQELSKFKVMSMLIEIINGTQSAKLSKQSVSVAQEKIIAKPGYNRKNDEIFVPKKSGFLKVFFRIKLFVKNGLKSAFAKLFRKNF